VLARQNADQVQTLIGDTRRWGINITVMNYSLTKDQVLREYKSLSSPNGLLIVEVDRLRSRCIERFLSQAEVSDYSLLEARTADYNGDIMIDRHCMVGKGVSLKSVILNHDVYVEKHARLENTVVMPNAIISAQLPIKNAIINEDMVYSIS